MSLLQTAQNALRTEMNFRRNWDYTNQTACEARLAELHTAYLVARDAYLAECAASREATV